MRRALGKRLQDPEIFWEYATRDEATNCLIWKGSKGMNYGKLLVNGHITNAHRHAYFLANGVRPSADQVVHHICHNQPCIEPTHLEVRTREWNSREPHVIQTNQGRPKWVPSTQPYGEGVEEALERLGFSDKGIAKLGVSRES